MVSDSRLMSEHAGLGIVFLLDDTEIFSLTHEKLAVFLKTA